MSCGVSWNRRRRHSGITPAAMTAFLNLLTTESAGSSSPTKTWRKPHKYQCLKPLDSPSDECNDPYLCIVAALEVHDVNKFHPRVHHWHGQGLPRLLERQFHDIFIVGRDAIAAAWFSGSTASERRRNRQRLEHWSRHCWNLRSGFAIVQCIKSRKKTRVFAIRAEEKGGWMISSSRMRKHSLDTV